MFRGIDCSARNGIRVISVMFSVKEVCEVAGVTRKTLFHYDQIGLLKPTHRKGKQGVKMYDSEALTQLLEIRLYRSLGFSIEEIRILMNRDNEKRMELLHRHSEEVQKEIDQGLDKQKLIQALITISDETIQEIISSSEDIDQLKTTILSQKAEEEPGGITRKNPE